MPSTPKMLAIRVNVVFQWRLNLKFDNVPVKPYENLWDLIDKHLAPGFEARGDPVMDWAKPSLKFKITGPIEGAEDAPLSQVIKVGDPEAPF
jgi:hypothetical protein